MKQMEDNKYDLAIVDPPYNIGGDSIHEGRAFKGSGKLKNRAIQKLNTNWDNVAPTKKYFQELFRVSKNQIIWGGNYFELPKCRGFVVWDKQQPFPNFSAAEYAWTSFYVPSKIFVQPTTRTGEIKIHPTQKSVKLYSYLLHHFAKPGDKILDTHGGSMSHAIACHDLGFDLDIYEIDKDYFQAGVKRVKDHQKQLTLL